MASNEYRELYAEWKTIHNTYYATKDELLEVEETLKSVRNQPFGNIELYEYRNELAKKANKLKRDANELRELIISMEG